MFEKEAIRRRADIEIAEREVAELLAEPAVDIAKVEAKVRETARLRADLRLARIKTLEQGKAILTAERRQELQADGRMGMGEMMGGQTMGGMAGGRDVEAMHRFMSSEQGRQAMAAMMDMASRMGDGDAMLGMTRMMQMMGGGMGGMMGGRPHQGMPDGMKDGPQPEHGSREPGRE